MLSFPRLFDEHGQAGYVNAHSDMQAQSVQPINQLKVWLQTLFQKQRTDLSAKDKFCKN